MLQSVLQNDTILKQLHQAVKVQSSNTINLQPTLINPQAIRKLDSIGQQDSISAEQTSTKTPSKITPKAQFEQKWTGNLDSITSIKSTQIKVFTEKDSRATIVLPEKTISHDNPDWIIGLFVLALILLASIRLFFNKYLNQLFQAVVNYATSSRLFRDRTVSITHASFRLDIIFYLIFSLFAYQLVDEFHISFSHPSFITYLIILGFVISYFVVKRLTYFLAGILADSQSETAEFLHNMHIHSRILGLFLIPVTLIAAFAALQKPLLVVYTGLFVCGIIYLLLLIRGAKILMTKHFSIFYLILYLCSLEILPLIFIYNLVLVKNGIK